MKSLEVIILCSVLWVHRINGIGTGNHTDDEMNFNKTTYVKGELEKLAPVTDVPTKEANASGPTILGLTLNQCTKGCTQQDFEVNCKILRSEQAKTRSCFCDEYCLQYGDCCYNYEMTCILRKPLLIDETTAQPISDLNPYDDLQSSFNKFGNVPQDGQRGMIESSFTEDSPSITKRVIIQTTEASTKSASSQPAPTSTKSTTTILTTSTDYSANNNKTLINEYDGYIKNRTGTLASLVKCVDIQWKTGFKRLTSPNMYVISRCPYDHLLKEDCENGNYKDISHAILVSNTEKTSVYKNLFCAQCNGLVNDEINIWQPHFLCNDTIKSNLEELKEEKKLMEYFSVLTNGCTIKYDPIDPDVVEQSLCTKDAIDSCEGDVTIKDFETLEIACRSYRSDVQGSLSKVLYKNEHCALCNSELQTELACVELEGFDSGRLGSSLDTTEGLKLTSFALLIDFSSGGLRVETKDIIHVECPDGYKYEADSEECLNQTQNFTTLSNVTKSKTKHTHSDIQEILMLVEKYATVVGTSLSITALFITICVYIALPSLRNIPGLCTMNLSIALVTAQLLFLVSPYGVQIPTLCTILAAIQHYTWLAAFSWMSTMAFIVCRTFSTMSRVGAPGRVKFAPYLIYNWGIPILGVCVCLVIDLATEVEFHYGGTVACWIVGDRALIYSFAIPIGCVIITNMILFSVTVYHIQKAANVAKQATSTNGDKARFLAYVKLTSIMGFTWIFGFLGSFLKSQPLFLVFILLNTMQGVFILFSFILSDRTKTLCKKRLYNEPGSTVTRSSNYEKSSTKI